MENQKPEFEKDEASTTKPLSEAPVDLPKTQEPVKRKKGIILICIFASILIILFFFGYIPRLIHWKSLESRAEKINPLIVKVMTAIPNKEAIELVLPSTTQALRMTPIWARVDGYIKNFYVDIGDRVKENQLLAEIDTPELDHQLGQSKADLANAVARLEIAKITADRWVDLFSTDSEAVSTQEVDERTSAFQSEIAAVEAAEANVERLKKIKGFSWLYAPFAGVITERNIDIGTLITAGSQGNLQQIYQLAKIDMIRIFTNVPQPYFRLIKVGDVTHVSLNEYPERIFQGIIARTASALDPIARTLSTEIHVNNEDGALITGLYVTVKFILTPDTLNYIIPTSAVIIRDGHPHVAIVDENSIVHLRRVTIGKNYGKTIDITSGIQEFDQVITNPNDKIRDGVQVKVVNGE